MRKLASIQKVLNIRPIPGADLIEAVDVLGWTVVTQKGNYKVGDLCIYFEIDSFLNAEDPRFASFEERFINWGDKRGMRLKTIKLRKQISQGLTLPLRDFPEIKNPQEGDDVTELLKIEKWESLSESQGNGGGMGGKTAGATPFPAFLRKTDQERVQNYMAELRKHDQETFEVSIKLDGSSMTVFYINDQSPHFKFAWEDIEKRKLRNLNPLKKVLYKLGKLVGLNKPPKFISGLCSRNIQLDPAHSNHFSQYVKDKEILETLERMDINIAIQGELIGPSIQQNHENVEGLEFYVYDTFNIDAQKYDKPVGARTITQLAGLNYVPVLNTDAKLSDFADKENPEDYRKMVDNILAFAEGPGMNQGVKREGIVFKSNSDGPYETEFSFKAISNSYLLKKG